MDNVKKFGLVAAALGVLVLMSLIVWRQHNAIVEQREAAQKSLVEMKELRDGVVRAQAQYLSRKDLDDFAKKQNINLEPIKKDLDRLNASLQGISAVVVSTSGYSGTGLVSHSTIPKSNDSNNSNPTSGINIPCPPGGKVTCPTTDPFGYLSNAQVLGLNEPSSGSNGGINIPWGRTEFRAWESKPWSLNIYPRDYSVVTVLGKDEEGRHYTYHKFTVTTQGKKYDLKIRDAKFVEQLPQSKLRFTPRLYMSVDVGTQVPVLQPELTPNLQISLLSYGKTKTDPVWTFLGIGGGYETQAKKPAVVISPVNYNLGQNLPLIDNLHVGPTVTYDLDGKFSVLGGVRVGL